MSDKSNYDNQELKVLLDRLHQFPQILQTYNNAVGYVKPNLSNQAFKQWLDIGVQMIDKKQYNNHTAEKYFCNSIPLSTKLGNAQLILWGEVGLSIFKRSSILCCAYLDASLESIPKFVPPRHIDTWANMCRSLYKGTWQSSNLAFRMFQLTPKLLTWLSFEKLKQLVDLIDMLSRRSTEVANQVFESTVSILPLLGNRNADDFIELSLRTCQASWRNVLPLHQTAMHSLKTMSSESQHYLIKMANKLSNNIHTAAPISDVLQYGVVAINMFKKSGIKEIFDITDIIYNSNPAVVPVFLKSLPYVMNKVNVQQMHEWVTYGLNSAYGKSDALVKYFSLECDTSTKKLSSLSYVVELKNIASLLQLYCQALSAQLIKIQPSQTLVDKHIGWFEKDLPATAGGNIYLPDVVNHEPSKELNFLFYKVMSTHQAGYIEFGSFDFNFEKSANIFKNIRSLIETERIANSTNNDSDSANTTAQTDKVTTHIGRFFSLFNDNDLARDIFSIVESARVDSCIFSQYKGLTLHYKAVQKKALAQRPIIESLPVREALVEFIVRVSLGQTDIPVPKEHQITAKSIRSCINMLTKPLANVEDTAEATIRIYALLLNVANEKLDADQFNTLPEEPTEQENLLEDTLLDEFALNQMIYGDSTRSSDQNISDTGENQEEPSEEEYESPQEVSYRGDFKPELSQIMEMLQQSAGQNENAEANTQLTPQQIQELLNSPKKNVKTQEISNKEAEEISQNILKELQLKQVNSQNYNTFSHTENDAVLDDSKPNTYLYDEWDFQEGKYKKDWCLVHEKSISVGEPQFYRRTLANNAALVRDIQTQFEMIAPAQYKKHKRIYDGEEADFDALLEAIIDLRAKSTPDERIYWRRNKTERSVTVSFLLDMSASTAEAIEDIPPSTDNWSNIDNPSTFTKLIRNRNSIGRPYRRIIDVEKEGIVLLINALEKLNDSYGIYGFSGYGRDNVEFYTIKDIDEKFDRNITAGRLDRIAPLHATRMGPAIRHTIHKMVKDGAKSKFLFLISDGRPQDRGYSREGVEKDYAVHDTRMALLEAQSQNIHPFCLTVDKSGHDYLKTMMDGLSYEVLSDVKLLPQRLPQLYKKLTT